jgi:hypothetical protein
MTLFQINMRHLWGDYGDILLNGMTCHRGRKRGMLQLERTGPFVPALTLPGIADVLVTSALRTKMAASDLFNEVRFKKVIRARIVRLHWHTWNLCTEDPKTFPKGGEPEDYVLTKPHDEKLSQKMGEIYEALLPEGGQAVLYDRKEPCHYKVRIKKGSWNGSHLFRARSWQFVDDVAMNWLRKECGEWLRFIRTPY